VVSNGGAPDGGATGAAGSGSESEGQLAAVASTTYRFQVINATSVSAVGTIVCVLCTCKCFYLG